MKAANESAETPQDVPCAVVEQEAPIVSQDEIDTLIRKRVYGAMTLGLAPVPMLDLVGLFAIQVELVNTLAKMYGVAFSKDRVRNILGTLLGSALPVALGPAAFSVLKAIPLIGMTAGAATMTIMGGSATFAVGHVFNRHFASGGTLLDMDAAKLKDSFRTYYNEGKQYVKGLRKKPAEAEQAAQTEAAPAQSAS